MALFKNKKEESKVKKDTSSVAVNESKPSPVSVKDLDGVLLNARITEKSTISVEKSGAYVFDVKPDATKGEIKEAVKSIFKVTPRKVCITKIQPKKVYRKTGVGTKSGGKKAYVYLQAGDKIEFV